MSRVALGGQAKRNGVYGDVPRPAETCNHDSPHLDSPLACFGGSPQFVTSALYPGRQS